MRLAALHKSTITQPLRQEILLEGIISDFIKNVTARGLIKIADKLGIRDLRDLQKKHQEYSQYAREAPRAPKNAENMWTKLIEKAYGFVSKGVDKVVSSTREDLASLMTIDGILALLGLGLISTLVGMVAAGGGLAGGLMAGGLGAFIGYLVTRIGRTLAKLTG